MISIQEELFSDCMTLLTSMYYAQWKETEMFLEAMPLDPDWDKYLMLQEKGALKVFTVKDEDTHVGYIFYIVSTHLHHKDVLMADSDIFYLSEEYRSKGIAKDLMMYAEKELKEAGVKVIMARMKSKLPIHSLVASLGFQEEEISYSKWVGE